MSEIHFDPEKQRAYFSKPGGIGEWWRPEDGLYRHHYARELQVIEEQLVVPEAARVADLGTGQGRFARFFARQGVHVTAVDISEDLLTIAQERASREGLRDRIDFVHQGIEEFLVGRHGALDVISLMEVLDHLPDPAGVIALCAKALRPGGQLVLTFVSQASLYGHLAALVLPRTRSRDLRVARPYPPSVVAAWLESVGFQYRPFGVGLLSIIARETVAAPFGPVLGSLCWLEGRLKKYYSHRALASRCVHVVGIARLVREAGPPTETPSL